MQIYYFAINNLGRRVWLLHVTLSIFSTISFTQPSFFCQASLKLKKSKMWKVYRQNSQRVIRKTHLSFQLRWAKSTVPPLTFRDGLYVQFADLFEVEFGDDTVDFPHRQVLGVNDTHVTGVWCDVTAPVYASDTVSEREAKGR